MCFLVYVVLLHLKLEVTQPRMSPRINRGQPCVSYMLMYTVPYEGLINSPEICCVHFCFYVHKRKQIK